MPACADTSSVSVKSRKTRTLTDDQRARKNKRRRELYHEKNQSKKQTKTTKTGAECNRDYKRRLKDFWENNLHPESIAMENPQFIPQIICKLVSTHEHIKISHIYIIYNIDFFYAVSYVMDKIYKIYAICA